MTDIIARAICDSYSTHSPRLLTMFTRSPTFNHQETLRHRKIYIHDNLALDPDFSFSVSSSRAIPFIKRLEECSSPLTLASPLVWGMEQKGMIAGDELDDVEKNIFWPNILGKLGSNEKPIEEYITELECAKRIWNLEAKHAANSAKIMSEVTRIHKTIPNRMVASYVHTNALLTATEPGWMNFFGLRLDSAAEGTLRLLAEECWKVWNESQPNKLNPGEWHLPYIEPDEFFHESSPETIWSTDKRFPGASLTCLQVAQRVSTSRNARLSLMSFETQKKASVDDNLKLYDRLVGSLPIHASPAEHIATPDEPYMQALQPDCVAFNFITNSIEFKNPHLSGNLGPGYIQYRKTLPNESIAPLPQGY